jgi:fluoride ion exporter CrcB/FEX
MAIGLSILIVAIGAVLRYAVTGSVNRFGFNLDTGGVILMVIGAIGLVVSLFWSSASPFGRRASSTTRRAETITADGHEQARTVSETSDSTLTS